MDLPFGAYRADGASDNIRRDLRRLFSTFARGLPGIGLLILRVVAGIAVCVDGANALRAGSIGTLIPHILAAAAGILLLIGLWTPIAGTVVALVELWIAFSPHSDPWISILLAALGAALALLGPGAWSVDARLFGWKRIEIPDRKN